MKSIAIALLFIASQTFAQNPDWARFYPVSRNHSGWFYDVYHTADNGFILCGWVDTIGVGPKAGYRLVKTDSEGEVEFERLYRSGYWNEAHGWSVIQCDDGGYLLGGHVTDTTASRQITILRTDPEGEPIWYLSGPGNSECFAVIEVKAGGYLACGKAFGAGFAMRFDDNANVIWQRSYARHIGSWFNAVREVEDGFLFGGSGRDSTMQARLVKTDENGEVEWYNRYNFPTIYGLISCRSGGFAATGGFTEQGEWGGVARLLRVDNGGNQIWCRGYGAYRYAMALTELPDGFVIAGTYARAELTRTDRDGDSLWSRQFAVREQIAYSLFSVISDQNGSIYLAGAVSRDGVNGGVLVKFTPERLAPTIVEKSPDVETFTILQNDSILFSVRAIDAQHDDLSCLWTVNGQEYDPDMVDTMASISFPEIGLDTVRCIVIADDGADTATWHVTVTDLFISAFTPDTLALNLHRGTSVDFSLDTIRFTDGDEPEILWAKTNLSNGQAENLGEDAQATIDFPWSGDYEVEGRVSRGESSDVVTWSVAVRGAIWAFVPEADSLEVLADSVVHFEVVPSAPEDESLTIQWFVDGEVVREGEVGLDWAFGEADSTADLNRRYLVQCVVADSVEADSVAWVVTVQPLSTPRAPAVSPPRLTALLEVNPNPFNSMLTIRFGLDKSAPTRLTINDVNGREVMMLVDAPPTVSPPRLTGEDATATHGGAAVERCVVWDASTVPAGVYFVWLQTGREVATKEVVLMR